MEQNTFNDASSTMEEQQNAQSVEGAKDTLDTTHAPATSDGLDTSVDGVNATNAGDVGAPNASLVGKKTSEAVATTEDAESAPNLWQELKKAKGLKGKVNRFFDLLERYPTIREMVMFLLFSVLVAVCQIASQALINYTFVYIPGCGAGTGFEWFIFKAETLAEFLGFMTAAVLGKVLTYVLNRKRTFRASNNLALSITLYFIISIIIMVLQTALPGWITDACKKAFAGSHGGAYPEGFVEYLINLTGTAAGGVMALILSFITNKFIVMRNWKKKAGGDAIETDTANNNGETNAE